LPPSVVVFVFFFIFYALLTCGRD